MSWIIGKVALPLAPLKILLRYPRTLKKLAVLETAAWVMDWGADVKILKLEGWLYQEGKTMSQLETDYLNPLKDMTLGGTLVLGKVLGDDSMIASGEWSAIGWAGGSVQAHSIWDSTEKVKKGLNAVKATIASGGAYGYSGIQRLWGSAQDWTTYDFVSAWCYGLGSGIHAIELYDGSTTKTVSIADDVVGWKRILFRLDQFTAIDPANILGFRLGRSTAGTTYFDRICAGIGQYVDAPETRYDGIYVMKVLEVTEEKAVHAFKYKMELWGSDEYY